MKTRRFNLAEREELSLLLVQRHSLSIIARRLKKSKSALSRETRRDGMTMWTYRAYKAHWHAQKEKSKQGRQRKMDKNTQLKRFVLNKLRLRWSPEQIARELKRLYADNESMQISHEAIYTYLFVLPRGTLKKELLSCLRQNRKHRHKQRRGTEAKCKLEDMLSIEERPKEVEDRIVPGHWEGDLIVGKNNRSALGTLVERTTRTTILVPVKSRFANEVANAFANEVKKLPRQMKLTMTYDQGREMASHKLFTNITGVKVYFAHPRSPWERGTNENTNGLIRQFFPKGTDFNKISRQEVKKVQHLLNGRPRKALGWRKPYEVFNELINSNIVAFKT